MKNLFLSIETAAGQLGKTLIAGMVVLALTATNQALAQSNSTVAVGEMISTVDFSETNWKTVDEFAKIVSAERTVASQKMAVPAEAILYTGYDRMLGQIQADLQQKKPIEGIAEAAYLKVLADAPGDPVLKDLVTPDFAILYAALVTKLSAF